METIDNPIDLRDVADVLRGGPDLRDPYGYHVTNLYHDSQLIAKGKEKPDYSELEGAADLGFIWEYTIRKWMERYFYPYNLVYPPTIEVDGIKMSMDAIALPPKDTFVPRVIDAKLKFEKFKGINDRPDWLWQFKSYCKGVQIFLGMPCFDVSVVMLNILSRPPRCYGKVIDIRFTQQEIEENWSTVINTRDYIEQTNIVPF